MKTAHAARIRCRLVPFVAACCWASPAIDRSPGAEVAQPASRVFYVDGTGIGGPPNDAGPGTHDRPWRTPWKAFAAAGPGDVVVLRRGVYRMSRTVQTSDFRLDPSRSGQITFRASPGEEVVVTNLAPVPADAWRPIGTTPSGRTVYAAPSGDDGRVTNLTLDGVPLIRAPTDDPRYPHRDSLPEALTEPGRWASSLRDHRVMLCTPDDEPPADRVELCDVRGSNGDGNLIDLQRDPHDRCRNLHLVFENLTFETGFYGVLVRTGFVELRGCVLRKSFGDLINTLTGRIVVDGCDFHAFGESAIDVTEAGDGPLPPSAPQMTIRNSRFHDNVEVRSPTPQVKGYNGLMLKGRTTDVVVENNEFFNLRVTLGALNLGGATSGGLPREGVRLTARNNLFRNISGSSIVWFAASEDCRFVHNLACDCRVDTLVELSRSKGSDAATGNVRPEIRNNVFYRNAVRRAIVDVARDSVAGLVFDHNLIFESGDECRFDEARVATIDLPQRGHERHGVRAAPRFRDVDRHDYRPTADSPVVDRGADLRSTVPKDAAGVQRPQGRGFDLGPFEHR